MTSTSREDIATAGDYTENEEFVDCLLALEVFQLKVIRQ